ncbi:uncharacterized protein LOC142784778 [Rhipicephalus microplus]|uniref:uncharacterized protein LOC142784778 n=1 Tax=Rhipicephalus microplus TaxID=6941 RepID=UPI003F6A69C5
MLVEEEDDDSSVASSPFDDGGFLDSLDSVGGAAGDGLESSSAAVSAVVEGHPFSPRAPAAATATTEATTAPDEPPDLSGAGPSMSSGEQHGYQLRRRIPQPPNAFMLFAMENRRSVAAENPNEDNQRVSTRLGKFWRSLSAAAKESYRRKAAVAAAIHRIKYPGYVYNPREAHRRKEQARIAKAIASKVKQEPSDDQELEAQSTSASLGPSTPALQNPPRLSQSPPPLPLQLRRWATTATLASTQADARTTPTGRSTAAAPSTASAGPVARPYSPYLYASLFLTTSLRIKQLTKMVREKGEELTTKESAKSVSYLYSIVPVAALVQARAAEEHRHCHQKGTDRNRDAEYGQSPTANRRHHPRLMMQQQQQQPVQRQQHTAGQQQQPSWGGSSSLDIALALDMIHQSIAQLQQPHPSMPTFSAAPEGTQQF